MSKARILSAFYQPKSQRFVELTSQEVLARYGYSMDASAAQSLMDMRGILARLRRIEDARGISRGNEAANQKKAKGNT